MASIVTAEGPLSTSSSVAASITAARLRATRGSRHGWCAPSSEDRPPGDPCDDCRTHDSVNGGLEYLMKQYDTVSYHKSSRRDAPMAITAPSPHLDHPNPGHGDHIPAEDLVTDTRRQRRILIAMIVSLIA